MFKNQLHERRGRLWGTDKTKIRLLSAEVRELDGSPNNYKGNACQVQEKTARKKGLLMEAVKLNNDMEKSSPSAAGLFYRRIGGTLFKVRVYTGSGYADTLDEKIPRLILNEMVTGAENYVKMDSPQMSQPPERSLE